jgi:rhodanese-related sulfurtransferase
MRRNSIFALIACMVFCVLPLAAVEHPSVEKGAAQTKAEKLHEEMAEGGKLLVIDVRTPKEYAAGHAAGAINVPLDGLAKKIDSMHVSKDTTIVTMCEHGGRSSRAALELKKMGYKTTSYCRLDAWKAKGYKMATGKSNAN